MRIKLTLLLILAAILPGMAQTGIEGRLVAAGTGAPIADANILLDNQGLFATSAGDGYFRIENAESGDDVLRVVAFGFEDVEMNVSLLKGKMLDLGTIKLTPSSDDSELTDTDSYVFDSEQISEDDGLQQGVGSIQGANDNVFYNLSNYNFSVKRYRFRGYNDNWADGYINGVLFNDQMRGNFSYSGLGGMTSSAFRNRGSEIGLAKIGRASCRDRVF